MNNNTTADDRDRTADDMERVTVRLPKGMIQDVKRLVKTGRYANQSEVIRDGLRKQIRESQDRGEI